MPRTKKDSPQRYFLCAFAKYNLVFLLSTQEGENDVIRSAISRGSFSFQEQKKIIKVATTLKGYDLLHSSHFTSSDGHYFLVKKKISRQTKVQICTLDKRNTLRPRELLDFTNENGCIVSDFLHKGKHVLYYGERNIKVAYSKNLKKWYLSRKTVVEDSHPVEIAFAHKTSDGGILVAYLKKQIESGITHHEMYLCLMDEENPEKIIWKMQEPIWRQKDHWQGKHVRFL